MRSLVLASAIILLNGCCTIPDQAKLPLPPPLDYPTIQPEALECLSDETYSILVERDTMCRLRVETLEDIIRTTH